MKPRGCAQRDSANGYSRAFARPAILSAMVSCAYCERKATMKIVSNPEDVCAEHAVEFWTGLLVCANDHAGPCVREQEWCTCKSCVQLDAAYRLAS